MKQKYKNTSHNNNRAFTLVEMALVIGVIGGLIAGTILYGSKVIENTKIVKEVEKIESFRVATDSFASTYRQLPGDLEEAHLKIPECDPYCNTVNAGLYAGDGAVGDPNWQIVTYQYYELNLLSGLNLELGYAPGMEVYNAETMLFWYELEKSGIMKGIVTDKGIIGCSYTDTACPIDMQGGFGESLPASNLFGGYFVGYSNGTSEATSLIGIPNDLGKFPRLGTVIMSVSSTYPTDFYDRVMGLINGQDAFRESEIQSFTPYQAARIDRKIDDGVPSLGKVHAYGYKPSCYSGSLPYAYKEEINRRDCGLLISIFD